MPLFRSKKDIEFIEKINQELIEKVIGEKITYYAISNQLSDKNFYGESKEKVYDPPVEIYGLIEWKEQDVKTTEFGQDIIYHVDVWVLNKHLKDIGIKPIEGDMIDYDNVKFEITKINVQNQIFGKAGYDIGLMFSCRSIRENAFRSIVSGTTEHPHRTYPDNPLTSSFYYTDVSYPYSGSS